MKVPEWVLRTFRKWLCADFCLNCGVFVLTPSSHCWFIFRWQRSRCAGCSEH